MSGPSRDIYELFVPIRRVQVKASWRRDTSSTALVLASTTIDEAQPPRTRNGQTETVKCGLKTLGSHATRRVQLGEGKGSLSPPKSFSLDVIRKTASAARPREVQDGQTETIRRGPETPGLRVAQDIRHEGKSLA